MRQILFEFWLFLASIDWGAAQAQARVGGAGSADPLQCRHSPWILASDWSGPAILASDWSLSLTLLSSESDVRGNIPVWPVLYSPC